MIDRIRQDIQDRLDQLLAEADRLRQALHALGGDTSPAASRSGGASSRSRTRATARPRTGAGATSTRTRSTATRARGSAGGTKSSVLKALADADGGAMTASEVASATGLGRASVSTTLSKLAKSGEVTKAERGYQLSTAGSTSSSTASDTADK